MLRGTGRGAEALADALATISTHPSDCVPWKGTVNRLGYGEVQEALAHRKVYEIATGITLEPTVFLDHICHTFACTLGTACPHRRCVNPAHLAPATRRANTLRGAGPTAVNARKTECNKGHRFTPENTYITTTGGRRCRTCGNAAARAYAARLRERA